MTTYQITFNEKTDFGKNLLVLFQDNKKQIKIKEEEKIIIKERVKEKIETKPTLLTEEEFDAKIQRAREQYKRGEGKKYDEKFRKEVMGLD